MLKRILIFAAVIMLATPLARADDEDAGDDPFLDDFDMYAPTDDFGGSDLLDGDIESRAASWFDWRDLPERFSLNPNSSFASVGDFDISGIMLGMSFESARVLFFREAAIYSPAAKNAIVYSIPREWRFNLDYECRRQKIFAPRDLESCINTAAKKRGFLYPSEMRLERPSTGESITVYFTSNATDNVVWKISYSNDVNKLPGAAEKFENQRDKKILAFWQMILEKYGPPNSGNDIWASSDNPADPFMTAGYGELGLIDIGLRSLDDIENNDDSRERFRAKPYSF
ncbi:MAG: hypothetical protein LBH81_03810 [Rickettsiales bacterium]|jgi:hypothetical protein|nr:hypothetical protein [Rickettsiales bacterium]